ncbi:hypothetical protein C2845_PM01G02860 [Panicum miliaceum]|uniref:Uncharacterized protein n=1 Tax=Panicum miliaceum TaxID=4540 RepID=A0A3L6TL52_PANMI|nr:hypothetical protein C2845_PM01G02860 [Panicum miliaceum]
MVAADTPATSRRSVRPGLGGISPSALRAHTHTRTLARTHTWPHRANPHRIWSTAVDPGTTDRRDPPARGGSGSWPAGPACQLQEGGTELDQDGLRQWTLAQEEKGRDAIAHGPISRGDESACCEESSLSRGPSQPVKFSQLLESI